VLAEELRGKVVRFHERITLHVRYTCMYRYIHTYIHVHVYVCVAEHPPNRGRLLTPPQQQPRLIREVAAAPRQQGTFRVPA